MEEMKKEMEKMKDQIKSLRLFYRVLSICFIVVTISFFDFLFSNSEISFWSVSTVSFNASSCSDVVALEAFVFSKISESILTLV